jgi:hypothetical protein
MSARRISPGVGSYAWISAPDLVIDSTVSRSPATLAAMSASTVNVVSTTGLSDDGLVRGAVVHPASIRVAVIATSSAPHLEFAMAIS